MRAGYVIAAVCAATLAAASGPRAGEDGPDLVGRVVDAATGKPPLVPAVVHITWTLRPESKEPNAKGQVRRVVQEIQSIVGGRFYVIDWRRTIDLRGWKLVPGEDPVVRIYAPGYRRIVIENVTVDPRGKRVPVNAAPDREWSWIAQERAQALEPLPADAESLAAELAVWRRDIDRDLAAVDPGRKAAALQEHERLLLLFGEQCAKLSPPPAACFRAESPAGRFIAERNAERARYLILDAPGDAPRKFVIEGARNSSASAQPGNAGKRSLLVE